MNVVSIMAHADDEMFCLGTMLRCRQRGDRLSFVTVTDGSKGFVQRPEISREEAAGIRHREMAALAEAVAGDYLNLRGADEFLYDTPEVRMELIEAIRRTRADVIFTHYREDYNLDHTTVSALVGHCAMHASLPVLSTGSKPLDETPAIFMVEPHGAFDFPATHYVDITEVYDRKIGLLRHHASQEEALRAALAAGFEELCAAAAAFRGTQAGCRFAEAFVAMPGRGTRKPRSVLP